MGERVRKKDMEVVCDGLNLGRKSKALKFSFQFVSWTLAE